jgi:hypothetical protein
VGNFYLGLTKYVLCVRVVVVRDLDKGDPHTCCTLLSLSVIFVVCTIYSVGDDHVVIDVILNHNL